jgi:NDP-sugar pyrophosphorylase family protein
VTGVQTCALPICPLLDGGTFVVVNGKIATDLDLQAALDTHRRTQALATLVLRPNRERERYSIIHVSDGLFRGIGGFPASDKAGDAPRGASGESTTGAGADANTAADAPLMYTGIQILEPRIFEYIPRGVFSDSVKDVWLPAVGRGERIAAHVAKGAWYELSTVKRYLETSVALMKREGRDVEAGFGSHVEEGADVRESVLWENVRVARGASVRRAVLGAGVRVGPGERFENVAVVRAELVEGVERPEKGLAGEVRGANFVAPLPE